MSHHTEQIEDHEVTLSNLDKVLYPDDDITKGAVIDYRGVADVLLPHLADRPLNLHRSPDGIDRTGFFQQHADPHTPHWVTTADVPARGDRSPVRHLVCQD